MHLSTLRSQLLRHSNASQCLPTHLTVLQCKTVPYSASCSQLSNASQRIQGVPVPPTALQHLPTPLPSASQYLFVHPSLLQRQLPLHYSVQPSASPRPRRLVLAPSAAPLPAGHRELHASGRDGTGAGARLRGAQACHAPGSVAAPTLAPATRSESALPWDRLWHRPGLPALAVVPQRGTVPGSSSGPPSGRPGPPLVPPEAPGTGPGRTPGSFSGPPTG